ncbi:hypothetical protein QBC46DRAFT_295390 [Diplogelasinospora grovesii]|uniref:Uncharacterized protein n=1 Tax=Diplogelasinospora grovesii TaxID=303347 RepID=A0AAN6N0G4_9PEZI|nr:hypothetical protein QBC46DRAFT_295390 [Diplogelasinospora grovesii]
MVRLLRCEQLMVGAEAVVVGWIRAINTTATTTPRGEREDEAMPPHDTMRQRQRQVVGGETQKEIDTASLLRFLPTIIAHTKNNNELGCPYTILEPPRGTPLAGLLPGHGHGHGHGQSPLTNEERQSVDRQTARLFRRLARLTSPSGRFGPASLMIGNSSRGGDGNRVGVGGTRGMNRGGEGASHWSIAFHSMLEGILRDGEDMTIMMPYSAIRRHFRRLAWALDAVTVPRLVAVDGGDEGSVLVDMVDDGDKPREEDQDREEEQEEQESEEDEDEQEEEEEGDDKEESRSRRKRRKLLVTGLRDWSNCIFGDPLFATVFSSPSPSPSPSPEFLEGFNDNTNTKKDQVGGGGPGVGVVVLGHWLEGTDEDDDDSDMIQDRQTAHVRILLYRAYHATVAVVREFYRPHGSESTKRELEARKRLNEVLVQLEAIQIQEQQPPRDMGQKREEVEEGHKGKGGQRLRQHPRPSGEVSPAKRAKTEDLEEDQQ